jgi:hypothetical protein
LFNARAVSYVLLCFCCCDDIGCWKIGSLHLSSDREAAPMFLEEYFLFFITHEKYNVFERRPHKRILFFGLLT